MSDSLLTLRDAAGRLGIHPATLRRWADRGEIPVHYTAGGHRRFAESDVARFVEVRQARPRLEDWGRAAVVHTRNELVAHAHDPWLESLSSDARERGRETGARLMGVLLRYVSADASASLEEEVRNLGLEYGRQTRSAGLPLSKAMQATVFFRDSLFESALHAGEHALRAGNLTRLLRRLNRFVNLVQLAIADIYDATDPRAVHRAEL